MLTEREILACPNCALREMKRALLFGCVVQFPDESVRDKGILIETFLVITIRELSSRAKASELFCL